MNRFLHILLFLSVQQAIAQPISWLSDCSDKTFCFSASDCTQGEVFMTEQATTNCGSTNINYSYKIDLFNNGGFEIQSSLDTVTGMFPAGTHQILWRASDNCGKVVQCTYLFTVEDCNPPSLVCINGLTQTIDPPQCEVTFNVNQFILSLSDNCAPNNLIERAMRRTGTGSGFPTEQNITFGICDNGVNLLEVWVRDTNGLMNSCNNYVLVQASDPVCECNEFADIDFSGCARSADNTLLSNYRAIATVQSPAGVTPPFSKIKAVNTIDSCFTLTVNDIPFDNTYEVILRATRPDASLNGVTTFDLVLISKHILGIQALTSAYQMEAADVNNSNSVTTFDIVETRKLILGINDTFTQVPSWRFVRPLANPADLGAYTAMVDTYKLVLPNLQVDTAFGGYEFVGIKYGDINHTAGLNGAPDDRSSQVTLNLHMADQWLKAGDVVEVPLLMGAGAMLDGWQLALSADPSSLDILSVDGLPEQDYLLHGNELRAVSYAGTSQQFEQDAAVFSLRIKVLQSVRLSQALHLNTEKMSPEAYIPGLDGNTMRHPILLQFDRKANGHVQTLGFSPNPFGALLDFNIVLDAPSASRLEIFTLDGKRVYSEPFDLEAGEQAIRLSTAGWPNDQLFVYRFLVGETLYSGKMVRM